MKITRFTARHLAPVGKGNRWIFPDGSTLPRVRGGDGDVEAPAVPDDLSTLSAEELETLENDLTEAFNAQHDSGSADLDTLKAIAGNLAKVRTRKSELAAEDEAAAAEIEKLRQEVNGTDADPDDDPDDPDADPDEDPDDPDAEAGEGADDKADDKAETKADAKADDKELVTASAGTPKPKAKRTKAPASATRANTRQASVTAQRPEISITAAADVPGHSSGTDISILDLATALHDKARPLGNKSPRVPVGRIGIPVPEDRWLNGNRDQDVAVIDAACRVPGGGHHGSVEALVAAGGWCAPSEPLFDQFEIDAADGLLDIPTVGISRGGIMIPDYFDPSQMDGALWTWTEDIDAATTVEITSVVKAADGVVTVNTDGAHNFLVGTTVVINVGSAEFDGTFVITAVTDADTFTYDFGVAGADAGTDLVGTAQATKGCYRIPCINWTDYRLGAEGVCVTHGNLQDRAMPELTRRAINVAMNAHERRMSTLSTNMLLTNSFTSAVTVTNVDQTDAAGNLLSALELQAEDYRSQHKMSQNAVLEVLLPTWTRGALRSNYAMRAGVDLLSVSDATINAHLAARKIRVQFVSTYQPLFGLAAPGAAAVVWPATVQFVIYPAGGFVKGTGGTIDLGVVRDSVLNSQNDFTALWTETFYVVARRGPLGRRVTASLGVHGATGCCDLEA